MKGTIVYNTEKDGRKLDVINVPYDTGVSVKDNRVKLMSEIETHISKNAITKVDTWIMYISEEEQSGKK